MESSVGKCGIGPTRLLEDRSKRSALPYHGEGMTPERPDEEMTKRESFQALSPQDFGISPKGPLFLILITEMALLFDQDDGKGPCRRVCNDVNDFNCPQRPIDSEIVPLMCWPMRLMDCNDSSRYSSVASPKSTY